MAVTDSSFTRPYLVIAKLIEQPTWGGQYIALSKGWQKHELLNKARIGQSYELFSGTNLSLGETTDDPSFTFELTDRDAVAKSTTPAKSVPLAELIRHDPHRTLGPNHNSINLLIKYTQALGNSFQVHLKGGTHHPVFKPKPESWYYFEPGLITLGVRPDINWKEYETTCRDIEASMTKLGIEVASGRLSYHDAQSQIKAMLQLQDPWRFVNLVPVAKDQLVDLTAGGLHHSWEEDASRAPLGNILYELQVEALDKISTFRSFDKGKMETTGKIRGLQLDEYFASIDRTPEANNPSTHIREAQTLEHSTTYALGRLMESRYYNLDKLDLLAKRAEFSQAITSYHHLFVKSGRIAVSTDRATITLGTAHSCFVPAGARQYRVTNLDDTSEILISHQS